MSELRYETRGAGATVVVRVCCAVLAKGRGPNILRVCLDVCVRGFASGS